MWFTQGDIWWCNSIKKAELPRTGRMAKCSTRSLSMCTNNAPSITYTGGSQVIYLVSAAYPNCFLGLLCSVPILAGGIRRILHWELRCSHGISVKHDTTAQCNIALHCWWYDLSVCGGRKVTEQKGLSIIHLKSLLSCYLSNYSLCSYTVCSYAVCSYAVCNYNVSRNNMSCYQVPSNTVLVTRCSVSYTLSKYTVYSFAVSGYAVFSYTVSISILFSYSVPSYTVSSYTVPSYIVSAYSVHAYAVANHNSCSFPFHQSRSLMLHSDQLNCMCS